MPPGRWRAALALLAALALTPAAAQIRFQEVAADWGLAFEHRHGGSGRYYQPETDGSGVAVFDYDGDGDPDVLFVDGGAFPGYQGASPRSRLYRNEGGGRFADVTDASGMAPELAYGMGVTAGDVDGDGDLDLYLTGVGPNRLLENRGDGTFVDRTDRAAVGDPRWSASAAFADVDRDGDLDLYVTNYLVWTIDSNRSCADPKTGVAGYCHPALLQGESDRFYRNRGDGTFEDRTAEAGFADADGKGLGVTFADFDLDGWTDLYVANDTTANFYYRNQGDGTFEDLSLLSGTAFSDRTVPEAGMGVAVRDLNGDDLPEIYVTNYALETNALYRNQGGGLFTDIRHLAGVAEPSIPVLGFGTAFADFDQDGDLDLAVANGHVLDTIEQIRPGLAYAQANQILEQVSPGRFREVEAGVDLERVSRGLATGDLDGDGDLELVISNSNQAAEVWENRSPGGAWLQLDLAGPPGNPTGVGARITVSAAGRRQSAEVVSASSYLSQSASTAHFGLGEAGSAAVQVRWPDGATRRYQEIPVNRRLRVPRERSAGPLVKGAKAPESPSARFRGASAAAERATTDTSAWRGGAQGAGGS